MQNSIKALIVSTALVLGACEGNLQINLTDAALDTASKIDVRITGIELVRSNETAERVDFEARTIDLTELTRGQTTLLIDSDDVGEGTFSGVRLILDAAGGIDSGSTITFNDGGEAGLALTAGSTATASATFTVEEDKTTTITIDFDARSSILAPLQGSDDYRLAPKLRLVVNNNAGTIRGTVAQALVTATSCDNGTDNQTGNAIYVFTGSDVTADDIDNAFAEPFSSATVTPSSSSDNYDYVAAFLPAGNYTVAFTCTARLDEPDVDDASVTFVGTQNVTVTAEQTTAVNF